MKILRDIWIVSENGIVLYSRSYDKTVNEQLFGALMSALNTFAEEIVEGGLSNFQLSNLRFSIIKKDRFIFIANSNPKAKEKKALDELIGIADKFLAKYSKILENWDSDVSVFEDFDKEIVSSLEETIKKFQDAFW